ncbi:MAG: T9SS type A sorting domain-containing protein [Mesonia hippocampi]|uniref:Ig-like domain-containing protein n=1 Tax=Mesonia hippocampi TaxID=1628250 RepID=UPI003F949095
MKKIYITLSMVCLLFLSMQGYSQVLLPEDFEDDTATNISDFVGWSVDDARFGLTGNDVCQGDQGVRVNMFSANTSASLQYLSQITTGDDIDVSFEYKIVDSSGNAVSNNFGTIDLKYTIDGGVTWVSYATIGQADVPASGCDTYTTTIAGANVPSGSTFGWKAEITWTTGDYYVYFDNFLMVEQVGCIQPIRVNIDESSITSSSVNISWENINTPASNVNSWEVYYCITNLPPSGNPDGVICNMKTVTGSTSTVLTGLLDGQNYFIHVRAKCASSDSEWMGDGKGNPVVFQTLAIGSNCENPLEVNANPLAPLPADLPYTHSSETDVYGAGDYSGTPGVSCNVSTSLLSGYEVVYHYVSDEDDILTVDVSNLNSVNVGVFVYESCADIGNRCIAGGFSNDGSDININSLFVNEGESYYIVIASLGSSGTPQNTPYTIDIEGFDCNSWVAPYTSGSLIEFVGGQTLYDFSYSTLGADVTIVGAEITWYEDNAGVKGNAIAIPSSVMLADQDVYWVTQKIGSCESPAVQITFEEFDCLAQLGGITSTVEDYVCGSGTVTLGAVAANMDEVYWFDAPTGGNIVGNGGTFTTPDLTETTSYWVSETFVGEKTILNQGNPGPIDNAQSDSNQGVIFKVGQSLTLVNVQVYAATSGTITVELRDDNNLPIRGNTFQVVGGTTPKLNTLSLNWQIPNTGTYRLVKKEGTAELLYTSSSDANFPYPLSYLGEITSSVSESDSKNTNYYYFYNWTIRGEVPLCETPRVQVDATVETIYPIATTADNMVVCVNDPVNLSATSANSNYEYTWTWMENGSLQTDTGAAVTVNPLGNTTYEVKGVDTITGCEYVTDIFIETRGVAELPVDPEMVDVCAGEIVKLNSGGLSFDFEDQQEINDWTIVNQSTTIDPAIDPNASNWEVVTSPYNINALSVVSNDVSDFFISNADVLGAGAELDAQLISPIISLVGVETAELEFYHYFKPYLSSYTDQQTRAVVAVSVNQGAWEEVISYEDEAQIPDFGTEQNFKRQTFDISQYAGYQDVRIRFQHVGGWGWHWAVDNVVVKRNYSDAQVMWSPNTGLYFDEGLTIPYDGTHTGSVYYDAATEGTYQYTATLDVFGCNQITSTIDINVYDPSSPVADSEQIFVGGGIVADLEATGTNLKWYILNNQGEYRPVTRNYPLGHGEKYYVTQTQNNCESDYTEVTAIFNCPSPENIVANATIASDGITADVIISWDIPTNTDGLVDFSVVLKEGDSNVVETRIVEASKNFIIIQGLSLETTYTYEVYTICDGNSDLPVSSPVFEDSFDTNGLSVDKFFADFRYYPNPTTSIVNFENNLAIEKIEVINMLGQVVQTAEGNTTTLTVDLSYLSQGTYFAKVSTSKATKIVKIIKK